MKKTLVALWVVLFLLTSVGLADLVAHWTFDEGQGTTAYDSEGNNNGTVVGATWTQNGKIGGALHFDGDDYVSISDSPELDGMSEITLASWVYLDQWASSAYASRIISKKYNDTASYELNVSHISEHYNQTNVSLYCQDNTTHLHSPEYTIYPGNWYHIAATNTGSEQKIYVNGIEVNSSSVSTGAINNTEIELWIGNITNSYVSSAGVIGYIDDVRIYNNALTQNEITAMVPEPLTIALISLGAVFLRKKQ